MLKKIQSNAFISYGKIRPTIYFNKTLNICLGPSKSTNSIGKTNFLMCIDFAFGGNDYVEKLDSILKNIEHHEIILLLNLIILNIIFQDQLIIIKLYLFVMNHIIKPIKQYHLMILIIG